MDRLNWLKEVRHSAEARYDMRWSPIYDENWGNVIEPSHRDCFNKFLSLCPPHAHILDAACGTGKYWKLILDSERTVFGIDQSQGMLDRAHEKFPAVQMEKTGLQEMNFHESFDAAICMDAMECVFPEDWLRVLQNIHRALKPNGYFYFTVEVADENEIEEAFQSAREKGLPVVHGEWADEDGYHFYPQREQVQAWVNEAGFRPIEESFGDLYQHLLVQKR
jgi:SAM-dependent methyltransferase